ncbi:MAG: hypothetical protein H6710_11460 [Myxococcales bacterium]|nr:hypothetical protein [Myxococcales bacterium]
MRIDDLPGLDSLQPDRVRQFMRTRGWSLLHDRSRPPAFYMYEREGELALVPGATVGDFARRIVELVEQLATVHRMPAWQLVDDLSAPLGDMLEIRIKSDSVRDGTLPLDVAATYRQAARDLLLAAAHAAIEPRAHFPRMTRKEPLALLARCREGQSARGSYRIRTIVPMDPQVGQMDLDPLARRTVLMVHQGAAAAVAAVEEDKPDALLDLHEKGVSANLLGALAMLEPPGEGGEVALAVRWSHDRPQPDVPRPVRICRSAFGIFRSASQSIRAQTPEPAELEGYVVQLHSSNPEREGKVSVVGTLNGGDTRKVDVLLARDAYKKMVDAHKKGQRVRLVGKLLQKPRAAELEDAMVQEIIDEATASDAE